MTPDGEPTVTLGATEELRIDQASARLRAKYAGTLDDRTIDACIGDSVAHIMRRAKVSVWVPVLAERFADERMRAMVRLGEDRATARPAVLFLCVHNAGRSQMAAGWLRTLAGDRIEVYSGGSEPAELINPGAVEAMSEVGIDITEQVPMPWSDEILRAVDVVVTMGCGDECPYIPGTRYLDWELDDPAGRPVAGIRPIRDEIELRVRGLMGELGVEPLG